MTQKPTPNNMQSKCYEWLISSDIAAYCEEIGHYFDPLEMAVIAEISGRPQKERHAFWREIIDQLPDMPVVASCNFKARDSLHELLAELIALEESEAEEFFKAQPGYIYSDLDDICGSCFTTAEKAIKAVQHELRDCGDDIKKPVTFTLEKRVLDASDGHDWAGHTRFALDCNLDFAPVRVHIPASDHDNRLDMKFIHIPMPFAEGDIVAGRDGKPRVLKYLPHWDKQYIEDEKHKYSGRDSLWFKSSDGIDMLGVYYWFDKGRLVCDHGPPFFYELSYYTGGLEGENRFLGYLSWMIKENNKHTAWGGNYAELLGAYLALGLKIDEEKPDWLYGWTLECFEEDSLLEQAIAYVIETGEVKNAALQAHFNIDYLRSYRIIEQLERRGIIGPYNGLTPQKALISKRYRRMANPSEVKPEQPKQRPDDMRNPHTLKDVFVLYEEEKAALTIHAKTIPWKIQIWMSDGRTAEFKLDGRYDRSLNGELSDEEKTAVSEWIGNNRKHIGNSVFEISDRRDILPIAAEPIFGKDI